MTQGSCSDPVRGPTWSLRVRCPTRLALAQGDAAPPSPLAGAKGPRQHLPAGWAVRAAGPRWSGGDSQPQGPGSRRDPPKPTPLHHPAAILERCPPHGGEWFTPRPPPPPRKHDGPSPPRWRLPADGRAHFHHPGGAVAVIQLAPPPPPLPNGALRPPPSTREMGYSLPPPRAQHDGPFQPPFTHGARWDGAVHSLPGGGHVGARTKGMAPPGPAARRGTSVCPTAAPVSCHLLQCPNAAPSLPHTVPHCCPVAAPQAAPSLPNVLPSHGPTAAPRAAQSRRHHRPIAAPQTTPRLPHGPSPLPHCSHPRHKITPPPPGTLCPSPGGGSPRPPPHAWGWRGCGLR